MSENKRTWFDKAEQLSKLLTTIASILALIAVPVTVALISRATQDRTVDKEYVQLGVEVLKERRGDPKLREWAVEVINEYSRVKFPRDVQEGLSEGSISLAGREHGAGGTMACSSRRIGEKTNCTLTLFNLDGFGDTLQVLEAWDMAGNDRVPDTGNLPLVAIMGNSVCMGSDCNPTNGVGCTLPCLVGARGARYTDPRTGLTLPGLPQVGSIRFRSDEHVLTSNDRNPLPHLGTVRYVDICDAIGTRQCVNDALTMPAGSATSWSP